MKRRSFLARTSSAAAGLAIAPLYMAKAAATRDPLVVDTGAGKVRGMSDKGTDAFLGIPYGASTAGAARSAWP